MNTNEMIRAIQDALVEATSAGRATSRVGGFVVMLSLDDPMVWVNYAVPVSAPTLGDVKALVPAFREAERVPRLEFSSTLWPDLPSLLEAEGFACTHRMPLMILPASEWQGETTGIETKSVGPEDVRRLKDLLGEVYGAPDQSSDESTKAGLASGRTKAALAFLDGQAAAGGFAIGTPKIREVAGIGTLEAFRRLGAAGAVIAHLLDGFFEEGGELAWLTPGHDHAKTLYERLGFRTVGEQVCYEFTTRS